MLRGGVLALVALALGRATVSFQFQSVTPLADKLDAALHVSPTALGLLLGLYMAPGAAAAIAAPTLLSRLGSARSLYFAFGLMAVGQCGIVFADSLQSAYAARLVAGVGGCVVYVLTVGFIAQLEDAGPLSRRMGVAAASWPIGNAFALVLLGASLVPASVGRFVPLVTVTLAAVLITVTCRDLDEGTRVSGSGELSFGAWVQAIREGFGVAISFALYNVAFILLTSFSTRFLVAEGVTVSAAATIASIPMWLFILSVPLGGLIAGRSGFRDRAQVVVGCVGSALCLILAMVTVEKTVWYVLAGFLGGLPTAPMWSSAGRMKGNGTRSHLAYPALFFVFFCALLVFPPIVGAILDWTGDARSALAICSGLLGLAALSFCVTCRDGAS